MQPLIVVGDRTSHGGVVIDGSPGSNINGKPVARVGNRATCPIKGHGPTTVIVSGDPTLIIDGAPAACHGDRTACGATLLSSQATTVDERGTSASSQRSDATPLPTRGGSTASGYDLRFVVKDEKNGNPLANVPYKLTLENGKEFKGITDQQGFTNTVVGDSALVASLEVPYYGDSSGGSYADDRHGPCDC